MKGRKILSLCDYSGAWSAPYREAGYEVLQIDIQRGDDVRLIGWPGRVHGILAAPPCTLFSKAGAWTWPRNPPESLLQALSVVDACMRYVVACRPVWWALENPPGRLRNWIGPPAFSFQPSDYGDNHTKLTQLWGTFCPPVGMFVSTQAVEPTRGDVTSQMSSRRKNERSQTPAGFARAFFDANP